MTSILGHLTFSTEKVTNCAGEPEVCRFAIIGHGDSWESIHQEIGHRPDVYMPGAVTGEKLAAAVASAVPWSMEKTGVTWDMHEYIPTHMYVYIYIVHHASHVSYIAVLCLRI